MAKFLFPTKANYPTRLIWKIINFTRKELEVMQSESFYLYMHNK